MYDKQMKALTRMAIEKEIPIGGMFELTSRCNLHCGFCYVCNRGNQTKYSMEKTADEWLFMIRQAVDMGLLKCGFTGGEPFMREDFEEIYCKAYDMGLRVGILTNGLLIGNKQLAYMKKRIPDIISISLYGASDESYRDVCGGEGHFSRIIETLDSLRAAGLAFELKVLAMRPLKDEYEALGRIVSSYHCVGKFDSYMCPGRDDPERDFKDWRMPPAQLAELYRSFNRTTPPISHKPIENRVANLGGVFLCGAGKYSFVITYDGRMLGCPALTCFDTYPFRDGFASAWQTLKDLIKNADACLECMSCHERADCYVCPADRLSETGSITTCGPYLKEMTFYMATTGKEATG